MQRTKRALVAAFAVIAVSVATLVPLLPTTPTEKASAAVASDFDPSYIISDETFYNGNDVSEAAAQNFLNWVNPSCAAGYTCLKNYSQDTWTRPADAMCAQYTGAAGESSARILTKVAAACGISVRVLITTLQKEQGLVTSTAPSQSKYDRAMGYACPDTAPCDAQYFGFFNQVYKAAWQFKRYSNPPGTSATFTWYPIGRPVAVRYSPNAACGAPVITIRNRATAALYYYTPYQPNVAALANLYGTGDACSSYGNRNFWRYYSDWFGSPTGGNPFGYLDAATPDTGGIRVGGWAIDPDTAAPISVQVSVDGVVSQTFPAALSRPDVENLYPGYGAFHGYDRTIAVPPGSHQICVTALNVGIGSAKALGCLTATALAGTAALQPDLPVGAPRGWFDLAAMAPGGVRVAGWALDPEVTDPIAVHVYIDGVPTQAITASRSNPGVAALYPAYGGAHGFDEIVPTTAGAHSVCVYAIGYGYGGNTLLGCATAAGGTGSPVGYIDAVSSAPGTISVGGWALDLDTAASISVQATVDGVDRGSFAADRARPDLAGPYPSYGSPHGFALSLAAASGRHTVCVTAVNTGAGASTPLGCATVDMPSGPPVGWLDAVTPGVGSVTVGGWAIDRDSIDPVTVRATVDGSVVTSFPASGVTRPDLAGPFPGYGANHGFSTQLTASPGVHTICLTAINVGAGADTSLGCARVTVLSGSPSGWFDLASPGPGQIAVQGWAIDRDSGTGPVQVRASVDGGAPTTFPASGVARPDLAGPFPGLGSDHGFLNALTASVGRHTVCLTAVNVGAGSDASLGCLTVDVRSGSPFGYVDSSARAAGGFVVGGWAIDPDLAGPVPIVITVNGTTVASGTANSSRRMSAVCIPGSGPLTGSASHFRRR